MNFQNNQKVTDIHNVIKSYKDIVIDRKNLRFFKMLLENLKSNLVNTSHQKK